MIKSTDVSPYAYLIGTLMERGRLYGGVAKNKLTDTDVIYPLQKLFSLTGADLLPNVIESFRRYAGENATDRDVLNLATSAEGGELLSQLVRVEAAKVAKSLSSSSGPQLTPKHKNDRCLFCERTGPGHDYTYCVAKPVDQKVDVQWSTGAVSIKSTKVSITYKYSSSTRRHICQGCARKTMLLRKWQLPAVISMLSFGSFAMLLIVSLIGHGGVIMGLFLFGLFGVMISTAFMIWLWTWCNKVPDDIPAKSRPGIDQLDLIEMRLILKESDSASPLSLLFSGSQIFRRTHFLPSTTGEHYFTWMGFVNSTLPETRHWSPSEREKLVAALAEDLRKSKDRSSSQ